MIRFSGHTWEVREQGVSGPGPNRWNSRTVWVDKHGSLHLTIRRLKGPNGRDEWHCAEVTSQEKWGAGRYEFQTEGRLDRLDRNVVLGLFDYPVYGEDPDGTNEIDIEYARWGRRENPNGNFTVYPARGAPGKGYERTFEYTFPGRRATHRFTRTKTGVAFAVFAGDGTANAKPLAEWTYAPPDPRLFPQKPLPVHLNLWLFGGKPPSDGREVEIVIKRFAFIPAR